jgi:hypothetical protein
MAENFRSQSKALAGSVKPNQKVLTVPPSQFDKLAEIVQAQFPSLIGETPKGSGIDSYGTLTEPKGNITVFSSGKVVLTGALVELVWPVAA